MYVGISKLPDNFKTGCLDIQKKKTGNRYKGGTDMPGVNRKREHSSLQLKTNCNNMVNSVKK